MDSAKAPSYINRALEKRKVFWDNRSAKLSKGFMSNGSRLISRPNCGPTTGLVENRYEAKLTIGNCAYSITMEGGSSSFHMNPFILFCGFKIAPTFLQLNGHIRGTLGCTLILSKGALFELRYSDTGVDYFLSNDNESSGSAKMWKSTTDQSFDQIKDFYNVRIPIDWVTRAYKKRKSSLIITVDSKALGFDNFNLVDVFIEGTATAVDSNLICTTIYNNKGKPVLVYDTKQ